MKSIEQLRTELRAIPKAMWAEPFDPFQHPQIRQNQVETVTGEDGSRLFVGNGAGGVDGDDEIVQAAPRIQQEFLDTKDRDVGLDSETGQGIDALAWYVSFHTSQGPWGIFVPTSSLLYLELRHFESLRLSQANKRQLALDLLLGHELFHFFADYACAQWEVLLKAPCWRALVQRRRDSGGALCIQVEEALANAFMLRTLEPQWRKSTRKAVRMFVSRQPPGYREAAHYVDESRFCTGLVDLVKTYVGLHAAERGLNIYSTSFDYGSLFPVRPVIASNQCPIHIIKDLTQFNLPEISFRFLKCIPEIVETEKFQTLFAQMPLDIQKRWNRKKEQLKQALPRHPEFENFCDYFSLRLGHKFRAHLRPVAGHVHWEAFEIGSHTKMGHG